MAGGEEGLWPPLLSDLFALGALRSRLPRRLYAIGRRSDTATWPEPDTGSRAPAGLGDRRDALITEASSPPKQLHTPPGRAALPVQAVY